MVMELHSPNESAPRHRSWMTGVALAVLGGVVIFGLSGLAGGYDQRDTHAGEDATLVVEGPAIIRNGEYDEMLVTMQARRPLANLALEMDAAYWRDMTINTMVPAPESEELQDGVMRFEFGPLDAGTAASFKIDAQVNPHRFGASTGDFVLKDGDREIARLSRSLKVLP